MTSSEFLADQLRDLETLLRQDNGTAFLAHDPLHALEILASSPAGYFAVLLDKGDALRSPVPVAPMESRIALYVAQQKGFSASPAAPVLSLVQRCESLRSALLAKAWPKPATIGALQYISPFRTIVTLPDGMPLAAYEMNFSLTLDGIPSTADA